MATKPNTVKMPEAAPETAATPVVVQPVVLAVFNATVKAHSGKGQVTAVVRVDGNECRLYGVTNLCKAGLLPMKHYGRYMTATRLAARLGSKPIIKGADACRKWLTDNKVTTILAVDIIADAATIA